MAHFETYYPKLLQWEGEYVNHPNDPGSHTNLGVTIGRWSDYIGRQATVDEIKALTPEIVKPFYITEFWDKVGGDTIKNQSIAEILCDHAVNAGVSRGLKLMQHILNEDFSKGLAEDGIIGTNTLTAINSVDSARLFDSYKYIRECYYKYLANTLVDDNPYKDFFANVARIGHRDSMVVFEKGWLNRLYSFEFTPTVIGISTGVLFLIGLGLFFLLRGKSKGT